MTLIESFKDSIAYPILIALGITIIVMIPVYYLILTPYNNQLYEEAKRKLESAQSCSEIIILNNEIPKGIHELDNSLKQVTESKLKELHCS